MFYKRNYWVSIMLLLFLLGCDGNNNITEITSDNQATKETIDVNKILQENTDLKKQVQQLQQVPSEQYMMDLRETMNLSLKFLNSMNENDYEYLVSVIAPGVEIDKNSNEIVYRYKGEEIRLGLLKNVELGNLEYWGSGYIDDNKSFQIILARFVGDTHGTIYFDYTKIDNRWLLNGIMTNA